VEAIGALQDRAKAAARSGAAGNGGVDAAALAGRAEDIAGARVLTEAVEGVGAKELPDLADRVKGRLGDDSAIVLGSAVDGKVALVAAVAPGLVARGVKAGAVVKVAAEVAGGGGGGRDTMAQAGGRDPGKLPEALAAARAAIESALA
jgi:alanyl-tRNA synthetase